MGLTFKPLGKFIHEVDVRNTDLSVTKLMGVNLAKQMMPSVANIVGTDLSAYKVVNKGQFVCKLMSVGRDACLPIALKRDDEPVIISSAYYAFEVNSENEMMSEYLMMCFLRPDFDRELWFRTGGDVRGGVTWDTFCKMMIPYVPISEQRKIVHAYHVVTDRIELLRRMNHVMEETLGILYKKSIGDSSCSCVGPFSDVATVIMGQSPEGDDCNNDGTGEPLLNGPTEFGFYSPSPVQWTTNGNKHCQKGDLLFCVRGSTTGRMNWADQQYAIGRGLAAIRYKKDKSLNWLAKMMISENLQSILAAATGTTFPNVGKDLLNGFQVSIPDKDWVDAFGSKGTVIMNNIAKNAMEMDRLLVLQRKIMSVAIVKGA